MENVNSDVHYARQPAFYGNTDEYPKINPKILSNELKDLEEHQLIKRIVHDDYPVLIEYIATDYSRSLKQVMMELHSWGVNHRKKLLGK